MRGEVLLKVPDAFDPWKSLGGLDSPTSFSTRSSKYGPFPPRKSQNAGFS